MRLLLVSFILGDSNWNFSKSVTLWTALQIPLWSKPHFVFCHKVYEIALSEMLASQMGVTEAQHQNQLVWIVPIWPIFALRGVDSARTRAQLCFVLLVSCYSLLQHSRPAWLELFVDHTHTHSMNDQRWQPHWLRRMTSLPRKSRDCEPETAFSASLKKRKSIINQDKLLFSFSFFH